MVKLTPEQQDVLTAAEPSIFQRIPNAWGDKGATWMHLKSADKEAAESAVRAAYGNLSTPSRKGAKSRG
jgi:hypothetical protein